MSKGGTTVRQTQSGTQSGTQSNSSSNSQMLDAGSQAYVDWQRGLAQRGIGAAMGGAGGPTQGMMDVLNRLGGGGGYGGGGGVDLGDFNEQVKGLMNPYMSQVVDATRGEFDHMRQGASRDANQLATQSGAFGGSRHGVMEGARLGEVDRAQGSQIASLLSGGYNQAAQQALGLRDQALQGSAMAQQAGAQSQANDLATAQFLFGAQDHMRGLNDPLARYQQMMGLANAGMGPTGWNQTSNNSSSTTGKYNGMQSQYTPGPGFGQTLGQLLGAGLSIGSMFTPAGAASRIPQGLSLAGGLLGGRGSSWG